MNFKQALIAHLQGEKVEVLPTNEFGAASWRSFVDYYKGMPIEQLKTYRCDHEFRLAPRTIRVNGVEVPAPEILPPQNGSEYYLANPMDLDDGLLYWDGCDFDMKWLSLGLVYLHKEDAIARAKAMLLTQE